MRIAIKSTESITKLDGRYVRVWEGVTEAEGAKCLVFVSLIAVPADQDTAPFDRRLCGRADPRPIEPDDIPELARDWEPRT